MACLWWPCGFLLLSVMFISASSAAVELSCRRGALTTLLSILSRLGARSRAVCCDFCVICCNTNSASTFILARGSSIEVLRWSSAAGEAASFQPRPNQRPRSCARLNALSMSPRSTRLRRLSARCGCDRFLAGTSILRFPQLSGVGGVRCSGQLEAS